MHNDDEKKPSVTETYAAAIAGGNTKVGRDPGIRTSGDIVAAAGMSRYRMGLALNRLLSEWNAGATPPTVAKSPDAKTLAKQAAVDRVDKGIIASEEEYGGMRVAWKKDRRAAAPVQKHEMEWAQAEARRLAAQCTDWHFHENQLRFQRLKTLPEVRAGLLFWVQQKGWEGAEHLVAAILRHFLAPVCPSCRGSGLLMVPGTLGRTIAKRCKECEDSSERGRRNVPYGGRGHRMLEYMQVCLNTAAFDLREGAFRMWRRNEHERGNQRARDDANRLTKVAREAEADAKEDTAAVAEHFRRSMGGKPQAHNGGPSVQWYMRPGHGRQNERPSDGRTASGWPRHGGDSGRERGRPW